MKRYILLAIGLLAVGAWMTDELVARGGRGGGGFSGGGGGGRGGGGGARPGGGGGGGGVSAVAVAAVADIGEAAAGIWQVARLRCRGLRHGRR